MGTDDLGYFQTDCRQQKSFFEHEGPLLPKMAGFSFGYKQKAFVKWKEVMLKNVLITQKMTLIGGNEPKELRIPV